jgi:NAD(P)H-hydrate epimerase
MVWLLPTRAEDSHKGSYGHLLVMAGSRGKTGAAVLSCRGAMRVGTGLVTLAAPRALNDLLAGALVEPMTEMVGDPGEEQWPALSSADWQGLAERKSAVLFGPGVGVHASTQKTLDTLLEHCGVPWLIDADGLNNLSVDVGRLRKARVAPVLTPHPGEMSRLTGIDTVEINGDRVRVARTFAVENRCYLVLKGARTVMATPDGQVSINPTGNAGMASGGMGDVLAGIVAGFLAQGLMPADAVRLGVYLHGRTGDRLADGRGGVGLIASDVVEELPLTIRELMQIKEMIRD